MRYAVFLSALLLGCASASTNATSDSHHAPGADATEGAEPTRGFVDLWWKADAGELLLELPPDGAELLYVVSLPGGLGSNDVGLDRGQLGGQWLLRVEAHGDRVLLVAPNTTWRTSSDEPAVRRSVEESFAAGVVFGFELAGRTDDGLLVRANDFLLRDAHRIAASLERSGQGDFSLDRSRSVVLGDSAKAFPDNSQVDALLTLTADRPGGEVFATAADPRAVTLRVRHSFVRLPEPGYEERAFHPRSGYWAHAWTDLTAELGASTRVQKIGRHRLVKRYRSAASSPPVEPIVYYVDRGAPEPVRTALLEGARYWEPVFEAAGFPGGFRVELLPEEADPHDVRYNVVQWVNRSTRGWSYGMTVRDPRTGEILKGHVTLGALRVRQDVLLADGLLSPHAGAEDERSVEMALARIRQLSAHEIGHTLGLAHNFAASAAGRASVMDYPAPRVELDGEEGLDLSDAYRDGCGEWDELAIRYGYSDFTHLDGGEEAGLAAVLDEARARGLVYLTDRDARGNDRAHPLANLWDNGADPLAYLDHELEVRRRALARFGADALRKGRALAELEEVLVPTYLHHRYQLEAAVRSLGGVEYDYALKGEDAEVRPVGSARQWLALNLALSTLEPEFLALPVGLLDALPPRPPGSPSSREQVEPGALFLDPGALAGASIELTLGFLLDPGRAARLADQARRDPDQPSWASVVEEVVLRAQPGGQDEIQDALFSAASRRLMELASDDELPLRVRRIAHDGLRALLAAAPEGGLEHGLLERFFVEPEAVVAAVEPARVPPGSPIGCGFRAWLPEDRERP